MAKAQITTQMAMNASVPPGFVVTKNEQGQLVLMQQFQLATTSNANNNNNIIQIQQNRPAQVVRPLVQAVNNFVAPATILPASTSTSTTIRPLLIQPQHILQQPQQQQLQPATGTITQRIPILPTQSSATTMIVAQQLQQPNLIINQQSISNQIQANGDVTMNKEVVENVRKCKNFLSTLLKLAANQPRETLNNVMTLIQGLVDNAVSPEEFTSQLQKELKSSPQPYLIPFLKKSLPYLRQFLSNNKMQIDGIRPPLLNNNNNNIITNNNNNNVVNNNLNNSLVLVATTQPQIITTTQTNVLTMDNQTSIRPIITTTSSIQQQQQQLQNFQQQIRFTNAVGVPSSGNNNNNNTTIPNNNNNATTSSETSRLLQTRFSSPTMVNNNNNHFLASNNNSNIIRNNLTTTLSQQHKLHAQQLAALHTNNNFIAPTTPLPSSLPRLILSSNSTLLSSLPPAPPTSTVTPTTTTITTSITTTAMKTAVNNVTSSLAANLLRNNNIHPMSAANSQNLQQSRLQQQQQHQQHQQQTHSKPEKRKFEAISRTEDDDINDVATMGGVNLNEETRNILSASNILAAGQLRSCTDEMFLDSHIITKLVSNIAQRKGLTSVHQDSINMLSHAVKEKLKTLLEQLSILSEHRTDIYKNEKLLTIKSEVKRQMKFRQEVYRLEGERVKEIESAAIMKAAKSRTKTDDPDQLKKKELAKKQQMQEMEDKRKEQSNITALAAIGPRKQRSFTILPNSTSSSHTLTNNTGSLFNVSGLFNNGNIVGSSFNHPGQSFTLRNRVKRATSKDLMFIMQQDRRLSKSPLLYKAFMKF